MRPVADAQLAFCRTSSLAGPLPDSPSTPSPPAKPPARSLPRAASASASLPLHDQLSFKLLPPFLPTTAHGSLYLPQSFRPLECELPTSQGTSITKLCPKPLLDKYFINTDWHPPSIMVRGLQGRSPCRWCSQKSGKKDVSYSQRLWQTSFIQY